MSGKNKPKGQRKQRNVDPNNVQSWWDQQETFNSSAMMSNHTLTVGKKKTKGKKNPKVPPNTDDKSKPKRSRFEDDQDDVPPPADIPEAEKDKAPLINLEATTPPIWTIGCLVIYIIVFICEAIQSKGFVAMSINPMYGPDEQTLILFGAKYSPAMLSGDWWRFVTAIFVHSGVIHLIITVILLFLTVDVERSSGFWRTFCIFLFAGIFGYGLSALLLVNTVSCGATGVCFGLVGLVLSDVISTWRAHKNPCRKLWINIAIIVIGIVAGLTPFLDNFCNLGGLIMGFLCALMLLPNLTFGKMEKICHGLIAFCAFPIISILFCIVLIVFYRKVDGVNYCEWCQHINCVNISGWCSSYDTVSKQSYNVYYIQ